MASTYEQIGVIGGFIFFVGGVFCFVIAINIVVITIRRQRKADRLRERIEEEFQLMTERYSYEDD